MLDLDFIEICYHPTLDDETWGSALAGGVARLLRHTDGVMSSAYVVTPGEGGRYIGLVGDARFREDDGLVEAATHCMRDLNRSPDRQRLLGGTYAVSEPGVALLSELPRSVQTPIRRNLPWPSGDCLGFFGTLDGERGQVLSTAGPQVMNLTQRRREQAFRLCEHMATGYWLRALRSPATPLESSAAAICTPDGKVLHHDVSSAPELSNGLVDAVRSMDRARCRRQKRSPDEATELWQALLAGQYTLVESFERSGRRLILAVRCRTPRPALTEREAAVAASAARGAANKAIAAELGLATGTIAAHLAAALRKLGCPSRLALSQWLHASGGPSS